MNFKNLDEITPVPTSHGCGLKKVLLSSDESGTAITQIAITELKCGSVVDPHRHPTMEECFLVCSGKLRMSVRGVMCECGPGCFISIEAGEEHGLEAVTDCRIVTVGCATKSEKNE